MSFSLAVFFTQNTPTLAYHPPRRLRTTATLIERTCTCLFVLFSLYGPSAPAPTAPTAQSFRLDLCFACSFAMWEGLKLRLQNMVTMFQDKYEFGVCVCVCVRVGVCLRGFTRIHTHLSFSLHSSTNTEDRRVPWTPELGGQLSQLVADLNSSTVDSPPSKDLIRTLSDFLPSLQTPSFLYGDKVDTVRQQNLIFNTARYGETSVCVCVCVCTCMYVYGRAYVYFSTLFDMLMSMCTCVSVCVCVCVCVCVLIMLSVAYSYFFLLCSRDEAILSLTHVHSYMYTCTFNQTHLHTHSLSLSQHTDVEPVGDSVESSGFGELQ
jgi:hypothetical protein